MSSNIDSTSCKKKCNSKSDNLIKNKFFFFFHKPIGDFNLRLLTYYVLQRHDELITYFTNLIH